jgi:hypothetical protein
MLVLQQSYVPKQPGLFSKKSDSIKDQRRATFNEEAQTDVKQPRIQKHVSIKEDTPLHTALSPSF